MLTGQEEAKLIKLATRVRENAYVPYSGYKVGAAVLTAGGKYYFGCNTENAAYTTTTHAEVNAINSAVSAGERRIKALAVVTDNKIPAFPCAICRQTMAEFGREDMEVIAANPAGAIRRMKFADLYPEPFGARQLGVDPTQY